MERTDSKPRQRVAREDERKAFDLVLARLEACGLLLLSDSTLPSVSTLVAGEPIRGSWWSHRKAQTIFQISEGLKDHADVLLVKLLAGKVTFVHRRLWREIFTIGSSRSAWQLDSLSAPAKALLQTIEDQGVLRSDDRNVKSSAVKKVGQVALELEKRLLVVATELHTDSGAHAKRFESWRHWQQGIGLQYSMMPIEQAMIVIEKCVKEMNPEVECTKLLPWSVRRKKS